MSYLVLARKWRPQTFADLVGQEHVAHTLQNAIEQGRIAHAFLFTGARGVGKTTIARVLAKAINCMNAPGPTREPCGKCLACDEIARGIDVDVKEIDGASNNSVDDVRRLQESLPYMPARDRFKVVIIDEVHMLSTGAFNALLKTLEEPPAHVKFIFATTEVHKVPVTILSRCQRYDFKLIPTAKIRDRVDYILGQEGIAHDDAAVALVAREAAGSLRDALSLLDQVIAGMTGSLTGAEAARLMGVADRRVLYDLARTLLGGDAVGALGLIAQIAREGYDLPSVARDFLGVLRDLVVARVVPEPDDLLDLADEEKADALTIARGADATDLERLFVAWSRTTDEVARAREPRWVLEMALVRLAHRPALVPVDELVAKLAELERRIGSGGGGAGGGGEPRGPAPSGGGSRPGGSGGSGGARATTDAPARPGSGAPRPAGSGTASAPSGTPRAMDSSGTAATSASAGLATAPHAATSVATKTAPNAATSTAPRAAPTATSAAPAAPAWLARVQTRRVDAPAPEPPPPSTPPPRPAREAAPAAELIDTSRAASLLDTWARVLGAMDNGPIAILKHAVPLEVTAAQVRIAYESNSFYARRLAGGEGLVLLAEAARRALGGEAQPAVEIVQGALAEDAPTIARREDASRAEARAAREVAAREHPFVRQVLDALGGEIRAVRFDDDKP